MSVDGWVRDSATGKHAQTLSDPAFGSLLFNLSGSLLRSYFAISLAALLPHMSPHVEVDTLTLTAQKSIVVKVIFDSDRRSVLLFATFGGPVTAVIRNACARLVGHMAEAADSDVYGSLIHAAFLAERHGVDFHMPRFVHISAGVHCAMIDNAVRPIDLLRAITEQATLGDNATASQLLSARGISTRGDADAFLTALCNSFGASADESEYGDADGGGDGDGSVPDFGQVIGAASAMLGGDMSAGEAAGLNPNFTRMMGSIMTMIHPQASTEPQRPFPPMADSDDDDDGVDGDGAGADENEDNDKETSVD